MDDPAGAHAEGTAPGPRVGLGELVESLWPAGVAGPEPRSDAILTGHRLAIVTNLPAHYRIPLFTQMGERLERAGAALRVVFASPEDPRRPWLVDAGGPLAFDHVFPASVKIPIRKRRPPSIPLGLTRRLREFAPTAVLVTGFSPFYAPEAARYAARAGVPFGLWSGEIPSFAADRPLRRLREGQRRSLARRAGFAVAYGSRAAQYLHGLNPGLPVVLGRNTAVERSVPRGGRGPAPTLELIMVADLSSPGKGVELVLEALHEVPGLDCRLSIIGGSPRGELAALGARDPRVRFLGALPKDEVRAAYLESDVLMYPTRADIFGLAMGEAMAAGTAVVTTMHPGAAADLAVDGVNALVLDGHTVAEWAGALRRLAEDRALVGRMAEAARLTVDRRWGYPHAVEGMVSALRLAALVSAHG